MPPKKTSTPRGSPSVNKAKNGNMRTTPVTTRSRRRVVASTDISTQKNKATRSKVRRKKSHATEDHLTILNDDAVTSTPRVQTRSKKSQAGNVALDDVPSTSGAADRLPTPIIDGRAVSPILESGSGNATPIKKMSASNKRTRVMSLAEASRGLSLVNGTPLQIPAQKYKHYFFSNRPNTSLNNVNDCLNAGIIPRVHLGGSAKLRRMLIDVKKKQTELLAKDDPKAMTQEAYEKRINQLTERIAAAENWEARREAEVVEQITPQVENGRKEPSIIELSDGPDLTPVEPYRPPRPVQLEFTSDMTPEQREAKRQQILRELGEYQRSGNRNPPPYYRAVETELENIRAKAYIDEVFAIANDKPPVQPEPKFKTIYECKAHYEKLEEEREKIKNELKQEESSDDVPLESSTPRNLKLNGVTRNSTPAGKPSKRKLVNEEEPNEHQKILSAAPEPMKRRVVNGQIIDDVKSKDQNKRIKMEEKDIKKEIKEEKKEEDSNARNTKASTPDEERQRNIVQLKTAMNDIRIRQTLLMHGQAQIERNQREVTPPDAQNRTPIDHLKRVGRRNYLLVEAALATFVQQANDGPPDAHRDYEPVGYKLGKRLGAGTFGRVFEAMNTMSAHRVACKRINKQHKKENDQCTIIEAEMNLKNIQHPNIVKLYEVIDSGPMVDLILELAPRGSLHDFRGMSEAQAAPAFYQLVQAVDYLHSHDLVHRDIKSSNILVDAKFTIKLADFGLCIKLVRGTHANIRSGTTTHQAPEMFGSPVMYNREVDIWAMGCVLYELIFRNVPFDSEFQDNRRAADLKSRILLGTYKLPENVNVSSDLRNMLNIMLQLTKERRANTKALLNHRWLRFWDLSQYTYLAPKMNKYDDNPIEPKIQQMVEDLHGVNNLLVSVKDRRFDPAHGLYNLYADNNKPLDYRRVMREPFPAASSAVQFLCARARPINRTGKTPSTSNARLKSANVSTAAISVTSVSTFSKSKAKPRISAENKASPIVPPPGERLWCPPLRKYIGPGGLIIPKKKAIAGPIVDPNVPSTSKQAIDINAAHVSGLLHQPDALVVGRTNSSSLKSVQKSRASTIVLDSD